jgi:hypothetical protein
MIPHFGVHIINRKCDLTMFRIRDKLEAPLKEPHYKGDCMRTRYGMMLVVLAAVIIPLYNCGNNGGPDDNVGVSDFIGNWSGTWSDTNGQSGTISLSISNLGTVTGSIYNATLKETASVSGLISGSGSFNFTFTFPGPTLFTASGTGSINNLGNLVGSFNEFSGTTLIATATFILVNTAPANG